MIRKRRHFLNDEEVPFLVHWTDNGKVQQRDRKYRLTRQRIRMSKNIGKHLTSFDKKDILHMLS